MRKRPLVFGCYLFLNGVILRVNNEFIILSYLNRTVGCGGPVTYESAPVPFHGG